MLGVGNTVGEAPSELPEGDAVRLIECAFPHDGLEITEPRPFEPRVNTELGQCAHELV